MPTRTARSVSGEWTLSSAARAMAKTVPGTAHGSPSSPSMRRPAATRRRTTSDPAARARPTAAAVAALAIQRLLTSGRNRSGSAKSAA